MRREKVMTLVFCSAVIALTASAHASANRESVELPAPISGDPLTDKHDFINLQKSVQLASGGGELERLFWMCDYAATAGSLEDNELAMCSAVTEQLKLSRFDGDSDKLIAWWRLNKEPEHQALLNGKVGLCAKGDV